MSSLASLQKWELGRQAVQAQRGGRQAGVAGVCVPPSKNAQPTCLQVSPGVTASPCPALPPGHGSAKSVCR